MRRQPKPLPEIFISKDGMSVFWFWIGLIALITGAVYAHNLVGKAGLRSQFILMTPSNTLIKRLPEKLPRNEEQQRDITALQTRILLDSIFNKSAGGLDSGSRAERLLSSEAWQWVQDNLIAPQREAFTEASLHQKLTVTSIEIEFTDDQFEASDVTFEGTIIRTGVLRRQLFNQEWAVRGTLGWERNTCLRDCARFPLLCTDINCIETLKSSTIRPLSRQEDAALVRAGEEQGADADEKKPAPPKAK